MELTHSELVEIGYDWVLKNTSCGVAFKELQAAREIPDVIGFGHCQSILIEAKASRSDFHSDKNKEWRQNPESGMGMFRFYIAPKGLIEKEELPENWGLIEVYENGRPRCNYNPYGKGNTWTSPTIANYTFERNKEAEMRMMYSALRRLQKRGHIEKIYNDNY